MPRRFRFGEGRSPKHVLWKWMCASTCLHLLLIDRGYLSRPLNGLSFCNHSQSALRQTTGSKHRLLQALDQGDVVALQQDLTCSHVSMCCYTCRFWSGWSVPRDASHTQLSSALALSLRRLLDLNGIVDDKVHKLVESLLPVSVPLLYSRLQSLLL